MSKLFLTAIQLASVLADETVKNVKKPEFKKITAGAGTPADYVRVIKELWGTRDIIVRFGMLFILAMFVIPIYFLLEHLYENYKERAALAKAKTAKKAQ